MKRRIPVSTLFFAIVVIILAVSLAVTCFVTSRYTVVGWQLFPKEGEVLDLRDRAITLSEFDMLSWKMPNTRILWSIPLGGQYHDSDAEQITISQLGSAEVDAFAYFPRLKTVDATRCTNYEALASACRRFPDIRFQYSIPLGGEAMDPYCVQVRLSALNQEEVQLLECFPFLKTIDAMSSQDFDLLRQLEQAHPEWDIVYQTSIAGTKFTPDTTSLTVTGAAYDELHIGLSAMKELKTLTIHDPEATGKELMALREEYPNVDIFWDVTIHGQVYSWDTQELDISGKPIESVQSAKTLAEKFPQLTRLIVDSTGIPNEEMGQFREDTREEYRVIWTIVFSDKCTARTDDTIFMPTKQGEYYFKEFMAEDLKYLEDVVVLDLGHHPVHTTTFLAGMPKLKYLILTDTQVRELANIGCCTELVFLEADWAGALKSLGDIEKCTRLEDLSINDTQVSIDQVKPLTWLKHLSWKKKNQNALNELATFLPDTLILSDSQTTFKWRNLQNYYDMRDILGMPYMN